MPNTLTYFAPSKSGFISIWLGDVTTQEAFIAYLTEGFNADFGFKIEPGNGPAFNLSEDGAKDIRSLLDGFSLSENVYDEVVEGAELMGWTEATTAVVFYDFKYNSDHDTSAAESPLSFIGVFRCPAG